ncbi:MAG: hypothetical protein WD397_17085 [Wenzhouxiangellaceae bacterium]
MNKLDALLSDGFSKIANWEFRNGKAKPDNLEWKDCAGSLYAFVTAGRIRYIGIATTVLRSRLDGYSYQINDSVGSHIKKCLESGIEVAILQKPRTGMTKQQLESEESRYIAAYDPDWNVRS